MVKPGRKPQEPFIKTYPGISYLLSPDEERFLKHMVDIEFLERCGHKTDFTRREYMERMGLKEYTFDHCAKNLCDLELISKTSDSSRNKVHYTLNRPVYDKLILIATITRNHKRLIDFFGFNILKLGRTIESITDEEIDSLRF